MIHRPASALQRKAIIAAGVVLRERLVHLAGAGVVQQDSLNLLILEMVFNKVKSLAAGETITLILVGEAATIMTLEGAGVPPALRTIIIFRHFRRRKRRNRPKNQSLHQAGDSLRISQTIPCQL